MAKSKKCVHFLANACLGFWNLHQITEFFPNLSKNNYTLTIMWLCSFFWGQNSHYYKAAQHTVAEIALSSLVSNFLPQPI